ncbi:uncharacterized protein LOC120249378 [Dioscorea cayenensis subsp. rotundata]|uniref:Uncharacterized protein LOC120249378 n=1 Tax=Dioscorea cayennensis subsp. rotundata TaxID=55577 RepID=A0AB40AFX7_DIOCR|nr:uncharacterized protein LOC120249378 [Dioscorea cayenensis subsp. rotundata]
MTSGPANVQNNMTSWDEFIIKYHHGGKLNREIDFEYLNGSVTEFHVDPDKLCYWDVLGDVKEIGCDINNVVELSYIDDDRTLKYIHNDQGIVGLVDQLRKHRAVDVYVEISNVKHDMILPKILLPGSHNVELNVGQDNQSENDSESNKDDDDNLVDVPFINYTSEG